MFITEPENRYRLLDTSSNDGISYWRAVQLALDRPWYLISLLPVDELPEEGELEENTLEGTRTVLVGDPLEVVELQMNSKESGLWIVSVDAVIPGYLNATGRWSIERVMSLWTGIKQHKKPEVRARFHVIKTSSGRLYPASPTDEVCETTSHLELLAEFPN